MVEMSAPARRVLAGAIAANLGPVEDSLDTAAHARCCLGLLGPHGLDNLHDQASVDGLHWQPAEHRAHIGAQRVLPLLPMLGVPPCRFVRGDVGRGASIKRHRLRRLDGGRRALLISRLDRVDPGGEEAAAFASKLACLGEADARIAAEAHIARPATHCVSEYPAATVWPTRRCALPLRYGETIRGKPWPSS